jgi:hypothetical protein
MQGMKSISAAIVVFAGAATFTAGSFHQHGGTQLVVCGFGLLLALAGVGGWGFTLRNPDDPA